MQSLSKASSGKQSARASNIIVGKSPSVLKLDEYSVAESDVNCWKFQMYSP